MATSEQLKALIYSHFFDENDQFYSVALQLAAHEAKVGHITLANEIKDIIDQHRTRQKSIYVSLPNELVDLVHISLPEIPKSSIILNNDLQTRINRIILEYRQQGKIKSYGLTHRRKILLVGSPGTGKTMTAKMLASQLSIPLYTIQVDQLVTKFMGETSSKLRLIFNMIEQEHGLYLFDEFDAIGGKRTLDNDVGEMRRVLNSFLQFIEQDTSSSLIVAATNNPDILDFALFRRFDDILKYELPDTNDRKRLIKNRLVNFLSEDINWEIILGQSEGLSHSEIDLFCQDSMKKVILSGSTIVDDQTLLTAIKERKVSGIS